MYAIIVNLFVVILIFFIFSLLYYTLTSAPGNWHGQGTKTLTYFDCLYIAISRMVTGISDYVEKSFTAKLITFFLYLIMLVGVLELISLSMEKREKHWRKQEMEGLKGLKELEGLDQNDQIIRNKNIPKEQ